jgi:biopolymer transport protein ExbB
LLTFAFACFLAVFVLGLSGRLGATARAAGDDDKAGEKTEPSGGGDTTKPAENKNIVMHIIKSAGIVFGPLLAVVSIVLVALIVLLAMDLRMSVCIPPYFVEEFTDTVNKRRFKEAFEMARNDNSFLGKVLTAGMGRLQYGLEDAREAAMNTVESVKASKDQLVAYLATIGTLGPMLGLVGTVFGMIETFMVMGSGKTPNPGELAVGISHALVITLLGIGISIPAIFCHAFFRNRLIRLSMDSANIADDLLTQMYHNSRKPAAATEARPVAATPTVDARAGAAAIKPAQ